MSTAHSREPLVGYLSLERQIRETERKVHTRQHIVAYRVSHLTLQIRKKMTSPAVLAAAFSGGFLIERVITLLPRRRTSAPSPGRPSSPGLLARLIEIAVLARALITAWPTALFHRMANSSMRVPCSGKRRPASTPYPPAPDYP